MYVTVAPPIAFPLSLDTYGYPVGLGATSPLPASTLAEDSAATALATAAALTPPPANIILASAAAVAKILASLGVGAGCGQACIQATNIVNQAEPAFLANLQQYENGQISQQQAQSTYASLWQAMQVACSAIPGTPGQSCLSDRQQGACKWHATGTPPTPYSPQDGDCWNWYLAYFVPLTYPPMNAPATTVGSSINAAAGAVTSEANTFATSAGLPSGSGVWLLAGLAVVAAAVVLS